MSKFLLLPAVLAIAAGDQLEWRWSLDRASLDYSIKQHLKDFNLERESPDFFTTFTITTKSDRAKVYSFDGHGGTVFCRAKDILYIAGFNISASGCKVIAVDLTSGKELWNTRLKGIPVATHSAYLNFINIETDGSKVIVYGNESLGRYVEHLDIKTGKTIANKTFKADPKSQTR